MEWFERLPERVRTVLIWAPIPLLMIIASPISAWVIFALLGLVGTLEWRRIVTKKREEYYTGNTRIAVLGVIATMVVAFFSLPVAFGVPWFFAVVLFTGEEIKKRNMLALAQIIPSSIALMAFVVRDADHGLAQLGLILVITSSSDIAAYFVGRAIGSRKFAPNISPNKTWEGAIGGWVAAIITAWIYTAFFLGDLAEVNPVLKLFYFWALAFAGQLGDLAESAFKRRYGVKDSGTIFPGHGGVLDRFDSFAGVIVVMFLFQFFLGI